MKIETVNITNFRGIQDLSLNFNSESRILVGVNGSGKTSVLDAICLVLSWYLARIKKSNAQGTSISDDEIRSKSRGGCTISIGIKDSGNWTLFKSKSYAGQKGETGKTDLQNMMSFIKDTYEQAETENHIPVIMFYPVTRAVVNAPAHLSKIHSDMDVWQAYKDALKGNADFRAFFEWYRNQEDNENEIIRDNPSYRDKYLTTIREAISGVFPEFSNLRVRRNPQRFVINKGEEVIEFNKLSQGEKCYLSLICDLARRFAIANPNSDKPLEGEGIVLIDEVDLHLHPKWQFEIFDKLQSIFPNCQFIVTTHSPQVLSYVNDNQITSLNRGEEASVSFNPYGKLSSEILNSYFNIPMARNQHIAEKIKNAYSLLRQGELATFLEGYEELTSILGRTDPDMVNLWVEYSRKK